MNLLFLFSKKNFTLNSQYSFHKMDVKCDLYSSNPFLGKQNCNFIFFYFNFYLMSIYFLIKGVFINNQCKRNKFYIQLLFDKINM